VGTHQDLIGGHEAKPLLIADSERIAHCGPSLIAPNAESERMTAARAMCVTARRWPGYGVGFAGVF
jgi:hypothetical protein